MALPIQVSSVPLSSTHNIVIAQLAGTMRHENPKLPAHDVTPKIQEDRCFACEIQNAETFMKLPLLEQEIVFKECVQSFVEEKVQQKHLPKTCGSTLLFSLQHNKSFLMSCTGDSAGFSIEMSQHGKVDVGRLTKAQNVGDPAEQNYLAYHQGSFTDTRLKIDPKGVSIKLSRTIACKPFQGVTCLPEVVCGRGRYSKSILLLCSDGFTDVLGEMQIKGVFEKVADRITDSNLNEILVEIAQTLIYIASALGSNDDISLILCPLVDNVSSMLIFGDGHGGPEISQIIHDEFPEYLVNYINNTYHASHLKIASPTQALEPTEEIIDSSDDSAEEEGTAAESRKRAPQGKFFDKNPELADHKAGAEMVRKKSKLTATPSSSTLPADEPPRSTKSQ